MSKGATKEEILGGLHQLINDQYTYLCNDPVEEVELEDGSIERHKVLSRKELITALSGAAKFLNDNGIKAPRFVSDTSELEETLKKKKKRFGDVIQLKEPKAI